MSTVMDTQAIVDDATRQEVYREERPLPVPLIEELCSLLSTENVTYCHWKSNDVLKRSASGANDLDLLVSRHDGSRFEEILYRLGFKKAAAPQEKQMPGVVDYFGYDEEADVLIHVHAHFKLILGHDLSNNYCLPIERPFLNSAVRRGLFKVPAVEFEFIVFVIRMMLKHSTWDVILAGQGGLKANERRELMWLQERISQDKVHKTLQQNLPYVSTELFDSCVQALQPVRSLWFRVRTGQRLQARLQANARRPLLHDVYLKFRRRATLAIRRGIFKSTPTYRLERGGAMLALVGGDGAGKSTAIEGLYTWLSEHFEVKTVHMGRPSWSPATIAIRAILKLGNLLGMYPVETSYRETVNQKSLISPGYPWLVREVCRARDRYQTYLKAARFAASGGLVIFDRFPISPIRSMDGPLADRFIRQLMDGPQADQPMSPHRSSRFSRALVALEERFYERILLPECVVVLRVDPEVAVQRKPTEDAATVRERSAEIWHIEWDNEGVHLINAGKSRDEVLSKLKALIWSEL